MYPCKMGFVGMGARTANSSSLVNKVEGMPLRNGKNGVFAHVRESGLTAPSRR